MTFTGILFLIIATVLTAMFSIVFKIFHKKDIDANQAIFFNYLTAFVLGVLFSLRGGAVVAIRCRIRELQPAERRSSARPGRANTSRL